MAVISLADADRAVAEHKIWHARGRAIQGYAGLEQSLCAILSLCTGMTYEVAAIIFFKISSARSRNEILGALIKKKFGSTYNLFWNSVFDRLKRHTDDRRNQIVHWSALALIGGDGDSMTVELTLKPARYRGNPPDDAPRLTAEDMNEFEDECEFYARLIGQFGTIMSGALDDLEIFDKAPWLAIFQQPIAYPPQDTHPQAQILATLQSRHRPSQT